LKARKINVSIQNNSNVVMDVMGFIFYTDKIVIDVETGLVTNFFLKKL